MAPVYDNSLSVFPVNWLMRPGFAMSKMIGLCVPVFRDVISPRKALRISRELDRRELPCAAETRQRLHTAWQRMRSVMGDNPL
jgi:hypothetical protein